jgi:nanoRNase/pAp phosphatase (c-di-AMP/oligoRNAs hydrolase)
MKGKLFHLGVGENPWAANKGKIHLGELVKKYGGGGHLSVGATDLNTKGEADRAREEILKVLNKKKR